MPCFCCGERPSTVVTSKAGSFLSEERWNQVVKGTAWGIVGGT